MSITSKNCEQICAELRKLGYSEAGETVITEAELEKAMFFKLWSPENEKRYRGENGHLVRFGFLRIVDDGYQLTGADLK